MLVPISWLKEYVDIKLPLKELMWKMTEAGLTCESYKKVGEEVVLDIDGAIWSSFTNTNSMDPVLDAEANGIEIIPHYPDEIH